MIHRRSLLLGLGSLLASPAIVRADSLMRIVRPWHEPVVAFREIYQGVERNVMVNGDVITVSWSRVSDATSYNVYRAVADEPEYALIGHLSPSGEFMHVLPHP